MHPAAETAPAGLTTTHSLPDRRTLFKSAANMRELGGLPVSGGVFASSQVYRSASLAQLDDSEQQAFVRLGITTVYDLRTAAESTTEPDRLPSGVRLIDLDVLADRPAGVAAAVGQLRTDPASVNDLLGGGKVHDLLSASYRDFVSLPSAISSYRSLFLDIADSTREGAALFHCTAGKDRTGWAAASLLMLLGASESTIEADYLQTNEDLLPTIEPLLRSAAAKGVDPDLLQQAFSVHLDYLHAAREELESQFGTVENYFSAGLTLDSATLDALRNRLVV